jgi:hypothetical protein
VFSALTELVTLQLGAFIKMLRALSRMLALFQVALILLGALPPLFPAHQTTLAFLLLATRLMEFAFRHLILLATTTILALKTFVMPFWVVNTL